MPSCGAAQPHQAGISFNLGLLRAEEGKRDDAERMLRAALDADPHLAPAAFKLAVPTRERRVSETISLASKTATLQPEVTVGMQGAPQSSLASQSRKPRGRG